MTAPAPACRRYGRAVDPARRAWTRLETVHAVTYFAPESRDAATRAGLRGFWMGYFGFRAAPLGAVGADVVTDAFWTFAPRMVARAIPDAWTFASPAALVSARTSAAAGAVTRIAPEVATIDGGHLARLDAVAHSAGADTVAAPLSSANAALDVPAAPAAWLWQSCTTVREHRGDAHVRALRIAGLGGCDAHVLFAAAEGVPAAVLRENRGWTEAEWEDARTRLTARGLVGPDGAATAAGHALRAEVEAATDAATRELLGSDADLEWIVAVLDPIARAVAASGTVPYPNPMGLPPLG